MNTGIFFFCTRFKNAREQPERKVHMEENGKAKKFSAPAKKNNLRGCLLLLFLSSFLSFSFLLSFPRGFHDGGLLAESDDVDGFLFAFFCCSKALSCSARRASGL